MNTNHRSQPQASMHALTSIVEGAKGYFVKRDWPYSLAIFFLVKSQYLFLFLKRENAVVFNVELEI